MMGRKEKLRRKTIEYADTLLKYPTRLRWVVFDATKFEKLLARFSELNNSMHSNLELEQRREHFQLQEATQLQALQVHDKLDQVVDLVRSLRLHVDHGQGVLERDSNGKTTFNNLKQLARFKAIIWRFAIRIRLTKRI
ncbi:hypothetical protein F4813DRAFT_365171 [Daldinia decipiens]|uniref:uncharacterized protein n=1 Tax=Daldinia decipiens TaxID=326647 RepID=UPI0020C4D2C5|nr:uncharacterized protein F4813DRAFT_365171 [Daldinia decipiens]KAI1656055.1 hypothetical protein F4813DRAFT_365171 [Daldinia decipiens]